jgi:PAS domain S-box-containing protein
MPCESESSLREALSEGRIVPYFQPLVDLRSGTLSGFEVLARWLHPSRGVLSPAKFISTAESSGLIGELTEQLLREAASVAVGWPGELTLSVNASASMFEVPQLPERLRLAVEGTGFPLSRLIVEITETVTLHNLELAWHIAEELKTSGIRLALDDVGTGYSSLHYLLELPFDEIKIDASFTQTVLDRQKCRKIVAALIGLGHSIGISVVAEGVETRAQADMLVSLECDTGQGWLFGRPVPAVEVPLIWATNVLLEPPVHPPAWIADRVTGNLETWPGQGLAHLHAIYDGAPVGLCLLDRNLRLISVNRRMAEISGISAAGHLGRTIAEVNPDLSSELGPHLGRALNGEPVANIEIHMPAQKARKQRKSLSVSCQPVRDEEHSVVGVSVAIVDITEHRRAEDNLRRLSGRILRAQDEERRRLARELHDSVAQMHAMASLNLAKISADVLSDEGREALTNCRALIDACSRELRAVCYLLHPPLLEELGLESALRIYGEGFTQRTGIEVHTDVASGLPQFEIELELTLFRVVQEALSNILRHSGSNWAGIRIDFHRELTLEIQDQGCGLPKGLLGDSLCVCRLGVGIAGMQERIRQFGGTVHFLPAHPGLIVRVVIPEAGCQLRKK